VIVWPLLRRRDRLHPMKRLHVHVSVDDFDQSIQLYQDFLSDPNVSKPDCVKWMGRSARKLRHFKAWRSDR
jgi:hypothetical protein